MEKKIKIKLILFIIFISINLYSKSLFDQYLELKKPENYPDFVRVYEIFFKPLSLKQTTELIVDLYNKNKVDCDDLEVIIGIFKNKLMNNNDYLKLKEIEPYLHRTEIFWGYKIYDQQEIKLCTNLLKWGILFKEKNKIDELLWIKRFIVSITLAYDIGEILKTSLDNGIWRIYDNDIKTSILLKKINNTYVDDNKKEFYIFLEKNKVAKIFNGNGRSEKEYYENARIKSIEGKTQKGKIITIEFDDTYGYQDLKLPKEAESSVNFFIKEINPGTVNNYIYISELEPNYKYFDFVYNEFLPKIRL